MTRPRLLDLCCCGGGCSVGYWRAGFDVEGVDFAPQPDYPFRFHRADALAFPLDGFQVRRHRLFEANWALAAPPCDHASQPVVLGVYGTGGGDNGRALRGGGGGVKVSGAAAAAALGIDWTTDQKRLSQAIPPAYTEHIGRQLIEQIGRVAA